MTASLDRPSTALTLDANGLVIRSATAEQGGIYHKLSVTYWNDRRQVQLASRHQLDTGPIAIRIEYDAPIHDDRTQGVFRETSGHDVNIYTQFEPSSARDVFPCIDEIAAKAAWHLTITAPDDLDVVANSDIVRTSMRSSHIRLTEFRVTQPLSTYLVAFAIGHFRSTETTTRLQHVPIRVWSARTSTADLNMLAQDAANSVDYFQTLFRGIQYPFPKLDIVVVPRTEGFVAMENAAMITLSSELLTEQDETTAHVVAHEVGHQWFGDLSTPKTWNDVWLSESLAEWFADKAVAYMNRSWTQEPIRVLEERETALDTEISVIASADTVMPGPGAPVLPSFNEARGVAYLNMLEAAKGSQELMRSLTKILVRHSWGSVTSEDFLDEVVGSAVPRAGFRGLLSMTNAPRLSTRLDCTGVRPQVAVHLDSGPSVALPLCLRLGRKSADPLEQCIIVSSGSATFKLNMSSCPSWMLADRGVLPVSFALEESDLAALLSQGWDQLSTRERRALALDVERASSFTLSTTVNAVRRFLTNGDDVSPACYYKLVRKLGDLIPEDLGDDWNSWLVREFRWRIGTRLDTWHGGSVDKDLQYLLNLVSVNHDSVLEATCARIVADGAQVAPAMQAAVFLMAANSGPNGVDALLTRLKNSNDEPTRLEIIAALLGIRDKAQRAANLTRLTSSEDLEDIALAARSISDPGIRASVDHELWSAIEAIVSARRLTKHERYTARVIAKPCSPSLHTELVVFLNVTFDASDAHDLLTEEDECERVRDASRALVKEVMSSDYSSGAVPLR